METRLVRAMTAEGRTACRVPAELWHWHSGTVHGSTVRPDEYAMTCNLTDLRSIDHTADTDAATANGTVHLSSVRLQ